jgi:hypothetical protein
LEKKRWKGSDRKDGNREERIGAERRKKRKARKRLQDTKK